MKKLKDFVAKIDWINTSFLVLTPLIALIGTTLWIASDSFHWQTLVLTLVMAIVTGIAITGGYHRLFAHKSYEAHPIYKVIMLVFGAAAFENTALRWASDHRNHHKYVDTNLDPYNIKRGFFYAHMGWVMLKYDGIHSYDNVTDLEKDGLIRFQHKHYIPLGIAAGFLLPTLLAALWGDPLGGFFVAGFLRTVMNHHFTFSINSFAHMIGKRPYSDSNTSRDSWFLALLTYGEGYHNYHHKFPSDYRNGIRSYHWDPTKWLIKGLEKSGLTYNLRKMPNETILRVRLQMDQKRMIQKLEVEKHHAISHERVKTARQRIEEAYVHFRELKMEYRRLKQAKMDAFHAQWDDRLEKIKYDLQASKERFQTAIAEWSHLCGRLGVPSYHLVYS